LNYYGVFYAERTTDSLRQLYAFGAGFTVNLRMSLAALAEFLSQQYFIFSAPSVALGGAAALIISGWWWRRIFASAPSRLAAALWLSGLIFALGTMLLAPFKTWRYSAAAAPFFMLLPLWLLAAAPRYWRELAAIGLSAVLICGTLDKTRIDFLYPRHDGDNFSFNLQPDIPVFILGDCWGPTLAMLNGQSENPAQFMFHLNPSMLLNYAPRQSYIFTMHLDALPAKYDLPIFFAVIGNWRTLNTDVEFAPYEILAATPCGYSRDLNHTFFVSYLLQRRVEVPPPAAP
jgi:hypothetical protein